MPIADYESLDALSLADAVKKREVSARELVEEAIGVSIAGTRAFISRSRASTISHAQPRSGSMAVCSPACRIC